METARVGLQFGEARELGRTGESAFDHLTL